MAAQSWLDAMFAAVRSLILRPDTPEVENIRAALEDVRRRLVPARAEVDAKEDEVDATVEGALDGRVTASEIATKRRELGEARAKVEDLEATDRSLTRRLAIVERNRTARECAALEKALGDDVGDLTGAIREISVCDERKAAAVKRAHEAMVRARTKAQDLGIAERWPTLWTPSAIVRASELDLVRLESSYFRYYTLSLAHATPSLVEQHRAAVEFILPPDPAPQPAAA